MRLNKFISHNSKYSRREADKLIEDGQVKVNKKVENRGFYDVKKGDIVSVKGRILKPKAPNEVTMIVYNKPKGALVTKKDDRGRTTIYHLLPGKFRHFIPVGRLDFASEGLLLLTDNPTVADTFMNAKVPRVYNIKIDKPVTPDMIEAMKRGLQIRDSLKGAHPKSDIKEMFISPFESFQIRGESGKYTKLRVTITEGKNRELRRFFGYFDAEIVDLKRVAFWEIELNNLPTNKTRYFTQNEYDRLHKFLKENR
jgi:23S rRNA pseudouridine2605 synthase